MGKKGTSLGPYILECDNKMPLSTVLSFAVHVFTLALQTKLHQIKYNLTGVDYTWVDMNTMMAFCMSNP
jgi:hypothetical protein